MHTYILSFHGVGPALRSMEDRECEYWLESDFFEEVLGLVKTHPDVGITVDDGNASDYTHILPSLLRHGLKATFFVCSGRLDQPSFLSRSQVLEIQAAGMTIGSHGVSHRCWRHLPEAELRHELQTSRNDIESLCGVAVREAACPFGSYDRSVLAALRQAGYQRVYTSDGGVSIPGNWLKSRTTVTREMSLENVRKMLKDGPGILKQWSIHTKRLCKSLR
ncbi:MAG: polysaccharide deacetylase family protein [Luteolibacter sp.]